MDYSKLRDLLKAGKWQEADQETTRVMLQVANREKEGCLRLDTDILDNFPCTDLRTINQLWLDYSGGKFGFSVQKDIYHRLGGTRNYNGEVWEAFADAVGWRKGGHWLRYNEMTFNTSAPSGHLPFGYHDKLIHKLLEQAQNRTTVSSLASRLVKCSI
ncbi:MAG: GUN4 domain-containing protein [Crocosphaera sp.]